MMRLFGTGGGSAVAGILLLLLGDSGAAAQPINLTAPVVQGVVEQAVVPQSDQASAVDQALGTVGQATGSLAELVAANLDGGPLDEELNCLATAVYFEAKGEPLQGQLAVAEVVENRARSGRYPTSLCAVVKQKAQFSFVRAGGRFPAIAPGCPYWRKAKAIARIAANKLASKLSSDVLWYHADYVAPNWGQRLSRVEKIGAHIFYRA